jgi:predicted Zn-dependent protease
MYGPDQALDRLSQVVGEGCAEVDGLEALLNNKDQNFVRFGCSTVIQSTHIHHPRVSFRAIVGGGSAEASTSGFTVDELRQTRDRAIAMARAGNHEGAPLSMPEPDSKGSIIEIPNAFDEATAMADTRFGQAALGHAFDNANKAKVDLAGHLLTTGHERALVNSKGLTRYFQSTTADSRFYATAGRSSGYCGNVSACMGDLRLDQHAERAIEKCSRGRDPIELPAGSYDVILEPAAVAELMEWLGYIGFTPRSVEDGTSFMANRFGETVTGRKVTLFDDGWCENGVGVPNPFDREGVIKQKVMLIERGVGRQVVYDTRYAAKAGCQSTGHAVAADESFDGNPAPGNLVMAAGTDTQDDLLSRVERGLWVTSFHYVNGLLEPRRAVMTGLTRHGTFEIQNGRLGRGVHNLRFTDSVLEAFTRIDGITRTLSAIPTWWSGLGASVAPTVLIRGLKFTGQTTE